jgi:hypothetical protein
MKARRKAATVVVAALGAIGLALPATAAASARSYSLPQYNSTMVVVVDTSSTTSFDAVSWSDVSWADSI